MIIGGYNMNIFFLDKDPITSAEAMTNKHVCKMILESAQLLCTAHRMLDGKLTRVDRNGRNLKHWQHPTKDAELYLATHYNHPSAVWTRESVYNYIWLYIHFCALCNEFRSRYKKTHKTEIKLRSLLQHPPKNIPAIPMTPVRVAITDKQWHVPNDPVQSYRNYYVGEKLHLDVDKNRYYNILNL